MPYVAPFLLGFRTVAGERRGGSPPGPKSVITFGVNPLSRVVDWGNNASKLCCPFEEP